MQQMDLKHKTKHYTNNICTNINLIFLYFFLLIIVPLAYNYRTNIRGKNQSLFRGGTKQMQLLTEVHFEMWIPITDTNNIFLLLHKLTKQ